MGITIFSLQSMVAPLQRLLAWLVRSPVRRDVTAPRAGGALAHRACSPRHSPAGRCHDRPRRPLRVVRVQDIGHAARGAGRMVISGRMADVCAELDRLAALEAAAG